MRLSLLGASTSLLPGCSLLLAPGYRFRMTVEAATTKGTVRGSAVYQVRGKRYVVWDVRQSFDLFGEALFLDHPTGPVFIPLDGSVSQGLPGIGDFAHKALAAARGYYSPSQAERRTGDLFGQIGDLGSRWHETRAVLEPGGWHGGYRQAVGAETVDWFPLPMVRFSDLRTPGSVEWVEAAALGINRIILETTHDEVTRRIDTLLPWLGMPWSGGLRERAFKTAAKSDDGRIELSRMTFSFTG